MANSLSLRKNSVKIWQYNNYTESFSKITNIKINSQQLNNSIHDHYQSRIGNHTYQSTEFKRITYQESQLHQSSAITSIT